MKKEVTNKVLWIFAVGQFGWSLLSGIITNWFVYFYAPEKATLELGQTLFIPQGVVFIGLTVLGLIAAVGRVIDAVTDPLIASQSDGLKHRLGRRIPFMRFAAIPFALVTTLIFISPVHGISNINIIPLSVLMFLFYIFLTMYCTPFNALIPVLGRTQKNRINLSTYISFTFILGSTVSFSLPNIAGFFKESYGYVNSFRIAVGILSVIAAICMLVPAFLIKEKDYDNSEPVKTNTFHSLKKTFENKDFRIFVLSDVLYWVALTLFNTGLPFYVTSLMGLPEDKNFILIAVMTACSLIFYPIVSRLSGKLGKKKIVMFAFVFFSGTFLFTAFSGQLGLPPMVNGILIAVLASLPMAILGILPQAIVADISESDSLETKENREGMFYAARTFAFKFGQAVAMLMFTSVKLIGTNNFGLRLTAIFACVFCLCGCFALSRYNEKRIYKSIGVKYEDKK